MVPHPRVTGPRKPHARPIEPVEPRVPEMLAEDLLGAAAIVVLFLVLFVILPVLMS